MHPALSIIVFTSASGAGYGLLLLAALGAVCGILPDDRWFAFATMAVAVGLVAAGLVSSTFHLGHPERAWRAMSQWRSSWLSREGVASLVTFAPMAAFGIGWVFLGKTSGPWALAAILTAVGAVVTVACTAMIYASLKTIRHWHNPWTVAVYYLMALASGALILEALLRLFGAPRPAVTVLALVALLAAWAVKLGYWRSVDCLASTSTTATATGLSSLGDVRPVIPAHTEENYLMREMGFRIARKHAAKLRRHALLAGLIVPFPAIALSLAVPGPLAALLSTIAAVSAGLGILIERWLFFAEAKHTVTLYYEPAAA